MTVKLPLLPVTVTESMPTIASRAVFNCDAVTVGDNGAVISPLYANRHVPFVILESKIVWTSVNVPPVTLVVLKLVIEPMADNPLVSIVV